MVYTRRRLPLPSRKTMAALGQVELLHLLEWLWRPMREWQSLSQKLQVCVVADWSVGFTVVSTQVNSIQIEVVSRQYRSRFETCRKSIRFNSIFRPAAGGEAGAPPTEIFRFELNSATKVEFCLLKWTDYQWKLHFPSIVDHSKIMYCCSSAQFRIV